MTPASESYDTIKEAASDDFIEKRSRFIGFAVPVQSEYMAKRALSEIRAANKEANHNCYAFVLRDGTARFSDDGEPQGTAGTPIIEVIKREGLVDVLIVVTRYFGGTLLGAGGLIRAYSHTARLAVCAAVRVTMCHCTLFMLECPYPLYEQTRILLEKHGVMVLNAGFGADVTIEARIKTDGIPPLETDLRELSNGKMELVRMGEEFSGMEG